MNQETKPETICVECQHYGDENRKAVRTDVQCKASPEPTALDPVSGRILPYVSVPGGAVFGLRTHKLCRLVNFLDCQTFKRSSDGDKSVKF